MQIEITSTVVNERSGNKNGKDWSIRTQQGYAHILDENGKNKIYPEAINIDLKKDQLVYPAGRYTVSDGSFFVGDYGKLAIGRLTLVLVSVPAAQSRAA